MLPAAGVTMCVLVKGIWIKVYRLHNWKNEVWIVALVKQDAVLLARVIWMQVTRVILWTPQDSTALHATVAQNAATCVRNTWHIIRATKCLASALIVVVATALRNAATRVLNTWHTIRASKCLASVLIVVVVHNARRNP